MAGAGRSPGRVPRNGLLSTWLNSGLVDGPGARPLGGITARHPWDLRRFGCTHPTEHTRNHIETAGGGGGWKGSGWVIGKMAISSYRYFIMMEFAMPLQDGSSSLARPSCGCEGPWGPMPHRRLRGGGAGAVQEHEDAGDGLEEAAALEGVLVHHEQQRHHQLVGDIPRVGGGRRGKEGGVPALRQHAPLGEGN